MGRKVAKNIASLFVIFCHGTCFFVSFLVAQCLCFAGVVGQLYIFLYFRCALLC